MRSPCTVGAQVVACFAIQRRPQSLARHHHAPGMIANRRGSALVIVLGLLSITLAFSYAMIRTQSMTSSIQQNVTTRADVRQAAMTGISIALNKMHSASWGGVETAIGGQLGDGLYYKVTYSHGDYSLKPEDEDYAEYPFRVTLTSMGYYRSRDKSLVATHEMRAVVQFVRRARVTPPTNWAAIEQHKYTIYQWQDETAYIEYPVQVQGPALIQGEIELCPEAPPEYATRKKYLGDLTTFLKNHGYDARPLTGPLYYDMNATDDLTRLLIESDLAVSGHHTTVSNSPPVYHPGTVLTYRLYAGGPQYEIVELPSSLSNVTYGPDPETNPLGIFRCNGTLNIYDNVTIRGTILVGGDIRVFGDNTRLEGIDMPKLAGEPDDATQLPVAIVADDFRVYQNVNSGNLLGCAVVQDDYVCEYGDADVSYGAAGRFVVGALNLHARTSWLHNEDWWTLRLAEFQAQLASGEFAWDYFPYWLHVYHQMYMVPTLTVRPSGTATSYHWHNWNEPMYVPDSTADAGLHWNVIEMRDTK